MVDVIAVLTDSDRPRKYWNDLKNKLIAEGSELSEKIGQLKMLSSDGKFYKTDCMTTEQLFDLLFDEHDTKKTNIKVAIIIEYFFILTSIKRSKLRLKKPENYSRKTLENKGL